MISLNLVYFSLLSLFTLGKENNYMDNKPMTIGISFTTGSRSHIQYVLEITNILNQRGHNIHYLTMDHFKSIGNDYNVTYHSVGDVVMDASDFKLKPFTKKDGFFSGITGVEQYIAQVYTQSFPQYEKFYKIHKPDLMICDYVTSSCVDSASKYNIPLIFNYQALGYTGKPPSYHNVNSGLEATTIENLSFFERFKYGIYGPLKNLYDFYPISKALKKVRSSFGVPKLGKMTELTHMGLGISNSYFGLENPKSLGSHIIPIGPIFTDNIPRLTEEFQSFLESHSKVLYIAFGSLIKFESKLSANILQHIHQLFDQELLDGVIWAGMKNTKLEDFPEKYYVNGVGYSTKEIMKGIDKRFILTPWAPQQAILNHQSTKLFLTHGGVESIYEAVHSATPMLVIPHVGDQPRNAMLITERGIGDYLEWPVDNDKTIHSKFVNLLDSNNVELRSKLNQLQLISKFSSSRKVMAADLVETYARSAQQCRLTSKPQPFETPCEVKLFLPLDETMSPFRAYLIDVYLFTGSLLIVALCLIFNFGYYIFKLFVFKKREKLD
jgi:hypothetical protein